MEEQREDVVNKLIDLIRVEANRMSIKKALKEYHPADIAEALEDLPGETKYTILDLLDNEQTGEVLDEASEQDIQDITEKISTRKLVEIVNEMAVDKAADFLDTLDKNKSHEVFNMLASDKAEKLKAVRGFESNTAGGIMTNEFFHVNLDAVKSDILDRMKEEYEDMETINEIFVCNSNMKLAGVIHLEDIIAAPMEAKASEIMDKATVTVMPNTDQEACSNLMLKYDLNVLPVVSYTQQLIGIITVDDILEVMEDEASEDMYRLAGVGDNKPLEHGAFERAYKRLPWFIVTIVGMSIIAYIMNIFEPSIKQFVAATFFIPGIMGLSGNVGLQSATITVRGLATDEIKFEDFWWLLRREFFVAIIIALVCAVSLFVVSYLLNYFQLDPEASMKKDLLFSLVVGFSMFISIITAVLIGTSIPMLCEKMGVDPAIASGPFITTIIDISAVSIYLFLVTNILI